MSTDNCFKTIKFACETKRIQPPVKIEDACTDEAQLKMWSSHFYQTLNEQSDNCKSNSTAQYQAKSFNNSDKPRPFTLESINKIIDKLDNKKAYKNHTIWKFSPPNARKILLHCLNKFWTDGENLDIWKVFIVPIPKGNKKDLSLKKSWRPISIGSSEAFILEKLILNQNEDKFKTSNFQFAYKKFHSTQFPIEILRKFKQKYDYFYSLCLDASAAFDKISFARIEKCLEEHHFTPVETNRLMKMLKLNEYSVKWKDLEGEHFNQQNGIKQGGCLSATIFACCYDSLVMELIKAGPGVEGIPVLIYADDICLISFSLDGVIKLYEIVKKWSKNDIQFNQTKSALTLMGTKSKIKAEKLENNINSTLNKHRLNFPFIKNCNTMYLGINLNDELESNNRSRKIYYETNKVYKLVQHWSTAIKQRVFYAKIIGSLYCTTVDTLTPQITTAYRNATKRIFRNEVNLNLDINNKNISNRRLYQIASKIPSPGEIGRKNSWSLYKRSTEHRNIVVKNVLGFIPRKLM